MGWSQWWGPAPARPTRSRHTQSALMAHLPPTRPRAVLNGKKKVFRNQFSQKSPRALHVLNHGWWRLAVGGWQLAVGGGWQLAVGRRWRLAAVGGWRLLAVGG